MHDKTLEEDLLTTSAQVSATSDTLDALEARMRELPDDDPRGAKLSYEIERVKSRLRRQTAIEGDLARTMHEAVTGEPA